MNPIPVLAFLCLISAIVTFGLGIFVFARDTRSSAHRLFLAAMVSASYWAAGEFMIWQSAGSEPVGFWLKASAFWPFVIAFTFHFILVFTGHPATEQRGRLSLLTFLYLPATVLSVLGLLTDQIYTVIFMPGTGYTYVPQGGSIAYHAMVVYVVAMMFIAISIGLVSWFRTPDANLKRQNLLVTIAVAVVVLSGALSGLILPFIGIFLPNTVFTGMILFSIIISIAILRHDLFTLRPETVVPDIIRTLPDGFLLADMDGRIVMTNGKTGSTASGTGEIRPGQPISAVIPEDVFGTIRKTVLDQATVTDFEAVLSHDHHAVVSIAASLVRDPAGGPAGIVLIIHDITRRKAQERALQLANDKISLLNQLTRHDISNLVTGLSSYLHLLKYNTSGDAEHEQHLASATLLAEKITRHLQFSKEYQEIGAHEPAWQPLRQMIGRAVGDLAHENVTITENLPPLEICADPLAYKVIYNLLENALRHGGRVTEVRIFAKEPGDGTLMLVLEDNGVGIRTEEKELIFQRGYGRNTGLGLTISREILSVTGITITENGTPGTGARFEIRIPPAAWRVATR